MTTTHSHRRAWTVNGFLHNKQGCSDPFPASDASGPEVRVYAITKLVFVITHWLL